MYRYVPVVILRMMPGRYEIVNTAQHTARHSTAEHSTAPHGGARRCAAELGSAGSFLRKSETKKKGKKNVKNEQ